MKAVHLVVAAAMVALAVTGYAASPETKVAMAGLGIQIGAPAAPVIVQFGLECDGDLCSSDANFLTWVGWGTSINVGRAQGKVTAFTIQYQLGKGSDYHPLLKVLESAFGKPSYVIPCKMYTVSMQNYYWIHGHLEYTVRVFSGINLQGDPLNDFAFSLGAWHPGTGGTCAP